ncbi:MAG TPA: hypothetical protein VF131_08420 [Blastocatellia bacterium]|nr:hypothetical protein [Blastocatellia bacterium]
MRNRILVVMSAVMLFIGWGCGSPPPTCLLSCQHLVSYSVVPVGCTTGGTITVCINGTLRVALDCNGGCNYVLHERINHNLSLSADPSSVYLPSPPSSVTITGQLFNATYAMPMVEYFDDYGYLIGTALATSVSSNGTVINVPAPDLSFVYSGTYVVRVTNKTSSGFYVEVVGTATMTGYGRDRPDSDGDGWYDDQDCHPYDPSRWDCNDPGCGEFRECELY